MSPTTNWSSKTMKKPLIRSFTSFCAPKPNARLATAAAASTGVTLKPNSGSAIRIATATITATPTL